MPQYGDAQPVRARASCPDPHLDAVTHSLAWAQESADRGDYADAVGWLQAVEATGDHLSPAHQIKHRAWQAALAHGRAIHKPRGAPGKEA
jgi:hypothetical protein